MSCNLIFYFSGTGNSFYVAKTIAQEFENTEIISMGNAESFIIEKTYESIGFVYPTYYWGLPKKVSEFIAQLNMTKNNNTYYYAIVTHGGNPGNALSQLNNMLINKEIQLNYGEKLAMFPNCVTLQNMPKDVAERTKKSHDQLLEIIKDIKNKQINSIKREKAILHLIYNWFIKHVSYMDKNFNISNECISCEICQKVCPVHNIKLIDGKPNFLHHCEQCLACIQFCPKKAINYKKNTQKRRRYTHPDVTYQELKEKNK